MYFLKFWLTIPYFRYSGGDEINDDNEENETNFISALFVEDDSECLINEQSLDSELEKILSGRKKITPEIVKVNDLYCHDDKGNLGPFIPVSMRKKIFNDYHLLSHPGHGTTNCRVI